MGKISGIVLGIDENTRSVIIKTETSEYRRPITKLALLVPAEEEDPHESDCEASRIVNLSDTCSTSEEENTQGNEAYEASSGAGCSHW